MNNPIKSIEKITETIERINEAPSITEKLKGLDNLDRMIEESNIENSESLNRTVSLLYSRIADSVDKTEEKEIYDRCTEAIKKYAKAGKLDYQDPLY